MAITFSSPTEYRRPTYDPRKSSVHICLSCAGRCVDLPRLGVACLHCGGTDYVTCSEAELELTQALIEMLRRVAEAIEYPPDLFAARRAEFVAQTIKSLETLQSL